MSETNHSQDKSRQARRAALGAFIGTTIEWYDFYVYGTAAALVIGKLFFPSDDHLAQTLLALGTFAFGFLLRPLGAIVFGYIGDKISRKSSLLITLLLMGGSTMCIGLLPTYQSIGIWAPVLLVLLRLAQGLSVGGEWGGAVLVASEAAPPHRKALAASMAQMGSPAGSCLATLTFMAMSDNFLLNGGWRIPFLLSGVLLIVGLLIRMTLEENPEFIAARDRQKKMKEASAPLTNVLRQFPLTSLCVFVGSFAVSGVYFRNIFALNWATGTLGIDKSLFLSALLAGAFVQIFVTPIAAMIADRISVQRAQIIFTVMYLVCVPVPLIALIKDGSAVSVFAGVILSYVGHGLYYATLSGFFTTLYPVELRFTGISFGYQLSGALVSGIVPLGAVALVSAYSPSIFPIQLFYSALILISLVAIWYGPRVARTELRNRQLPEISPAAPVMDAVKGR
ncbi:MFS transporter [Pandoraea anhela]|uniref:Inner membrane metabolite transport protein YhjE n=1 Tax=Pandoraea anhela TaxID=2508295 RepID=A0A5E4WQC8_9BURK|nr:MFS transporter [Pandoraea anhela]VVE25764.1 Inner membrane metabolite transport protein YhjE [Pandoraea anhela]